MIVDEQFQAPGSQRDRREESQIHPDFENVRNLGKRNSLNCNHAVGNGGGVVGRNIWWNRMVDNL